MILESGELESGGELLGERPGDGWSFCRFADELGRLTVRFGGRGKRADVTYDLAAFPAVGGRGVRLDKRSPGTDPDDVSHDVILPDDSRFPPVCTCRGFSRWRRCKHGAALLAVAERGLLDQVEIEPAVVNPTPEPEEFKPVKWSEIVVPF